eukprot:1161516-Pelagomonas_calceolata.AAC.2
MQYPCQSNCSIALVFLPPYEDPIRFRNQEEDHLPILEGRRRTTPIFQRSGGRPAPMLQALQIPSAIMPLRQQECVDAPLEHHKTHLPQRSRRLNIHASSTCG